MQSTIVKVGGSERTLGEERVDVVRNGDVAQVVPSVDLSAFPQSMG